MDALLEELDGPPQQPKAGGLPDVKQKGKEDPEHYKFWSKAKARADRKLTGQHELASNFYSKHMKQAFQGRTGGGSPYGREGPYAAPAWQS
jgi:hypothetical protein